MRERSKKMEEEKYFHFNGENKIELMRKLIKYTSSGVLVDNTLEFLENNKNLLEEDEYVQIKISNINIEQQRKYFAFLTTDAKYFLNIKKTTILIVLYFLSWRIDNDIIKTVFDVGETLVGLHANVCRKIKPNERCLLLDILTNKKIRKTSSESFINENKECFENDIECPYRNDGICKRSKKDIDELLSNLKKDNIIYFKNNRYKINF